MITAKLFDASRYTPFNPNDPHAGGYQVIENWKKTGADGAGEECTLVLTFDEKRKRRDEAILQTWVDIVQAKMRAGTKLDPRKTGWAALAKTADDAEQSIIGVDEEVLAKKKKLCGYASMVYKPAPKSEDTQWATDVLTPAMSGEQIAGTYRMLNRVETCSRALKRNFGLRSKFVRLTEHIRAHVDICVLALLLMRMIEHRLEASGTHLSAQRIARELIDMKVLAIKCSQAETNFLSVAPTCNVRRSQEKLSTASILELMRSGKLKTDNRKAILEACGLKAVPTVSSRAELAGALGTRFPSDGAARPELIEAMM